MAARSSNEGGSWGKRKNLFSLGALRSSGDPSDDASARSSKALLKKHQRSQGSSRSSGFSVASSASAASSARLADATPVAADPYLARRISDAPRPHSRRPSLSIRSSKRAPSVLESFKSSVRSYGDDGDVNGEPLSATPSKTSSIMGDSGLEPGGSSRYVLLHGEVQTSAGMFRKKKEYLVLTDASLVRYKSQGKAAETFKNIPYPLGRSPTLRHGAMPSVGSQSDMLTLSDSSGDKDGRVLLRQIVAIYQLEDGKHSYALEICYLDEESGQASAMMLQLSAREERDTWMSHIRAAVDEARHREHAYISPLNIEHVARLVERENDYDPCNCAIFKVVQRQLTTRSSTRSSSDDISKVASTVCFLALGVHKIHLIQLAKPVTRTSAPSLVASGSLASHGILTLLSVRVGKFDDALELCFRAPLQQQSSLYLASTASYEIAARLHCAENFLRPECGHRLFRLIAPSDIEMLLTPPVDSDVEEYSCFDRTLTAYCVAYGVDPANVRYTVDEAGEDAPRFELHPPADLRRAYYNALELLAIMRALRYNESFLSISFANNPLDSLSGLVDLFGQELICSRAKDGRPIRLPGGENRSMPLLIQEVRALAATNKKLRRMDFSACLPPKPQTPQMLEERPDDSGCGIIEALVPLCRQQSTNVDWICLNGIELSDTDLDYLVGAAVDKACHFRAIELNRCGLNDRSLGLILDALRAQENTLESLEVAGNTARLNPVAFDAQLGIFGFINRLNLSYVSRTSGPEALLQAETLLAWKLQDLRLSGTTLNTATVDAVATYLAHPQSCGLRNLCIDSCYLSGSDIAILMRGLACVGGVREMHLDISQNLITRGLESIVDAIAQGATPNQLSIRAIEYREESAFRKILGALTINKRIRMLDMSQTALPGDASEDTCNALERLLAENDTLVHLDLSGDDSRLAASKFGPGINDALVGLKQNRAIQVFRIEKQRLGFPGASTLSEVLRDNRTLLELHCDNNEIPLAGLTDLVNSLIDNTTLIHLPPMNDGRAAAFKTAEATMKEMSDIESPVSPTSSRGLPFASSTTSAVRKGIASVRKTAQRGSSHHSPSFPALSSFHHSQPLYDRRSGSALTLNLPPSRARNNSQTPPIVPVSSFTVQDIQTTHRLLSEQWDRQCYRLSKYLDRNWCILNNIPCNMEVEDEKFERPTSVGSIGKMLEQVKFDTTPRAERTAYFDTTPSDGLSMPALPFASGPASSSAPSLSLAAASAPTPAVADDDKRPMHFQHYIVQSATNSGTSLDADAAGSHDKRLETTRSVADRGAEYDPDVGLRFPSSGLDSLKAGVARSLGMEFALEKFEEPRTPTQTVFAAR